MSYWQGRDMEILSMNVKNLRGHLVPTGDLFRGASKIDFTDKN